MLDQLILNGTGGVKELPDLNDIDSDLAQYTSADDHEGVWQVAFAQVQLQRTAQTLEHCEIEVHECPVESSPFCSASAAQILEQVIEGREWKLLHEALRILAYTKKRLHPLALPAVLSSLEAQYDLYPQLRATVGERFRWLATQNETWYRWLLLDDKLGLQEGFNWPAYIWQSGIDITGSNEGLAEIASNLKTVDKLKICDWAMRYPHPSYLQVLPKLLPSRSKVLRRKVLNTTLQLPLHQHSTEINAYARDYMKTALTKQAGKWKFKPSKSLIAKGLTFNLSDLDHFSDFFTNPLLRVLALANPKSLLDHPLEDDLVKQLLQEEKLERAAQILICSIGHHRSAKAIDIMLKQYLQLYPKGNTVGLRVDPLTLRLSAEQLRGQIDHMLLDSKGRFFEKLNMLIVDQSPYLSRTHSSTIIDKISEGLSYELSHSEMINLDRLLPKLAYKLDSRIQPKVKSLWSNETVYYGPLRKSFPFFRKKLEKRHQILEAITFGA